MHFRKCISRKCVSKCISNVPKILLRKLCFEHFISKILFWKFSFRKCYSENSENSVLKSFFLKFIIWKSLLQKIKCSFRKWNPRNNYLDLDFSLPWCFLLLSYGLICMICLTLWSLRYKDSIKTNNLFILDIIFGGNFYRYLLKKKTNSFIS